MTNRRSRLRLGRALSEAKTLRAKLVREWRWLVRDLRDAKAELRDHLKRESHERDPVALAEDADHVYWSDPDTGTIGRAAKDGSTVDASFVVLKRESHG